MRTFNDAQINYLNSVESDVSGRFKVYMQDVDPDKTNYKRNGTTLNGPDAGGTGSFAHDPLYIKYTPYKVPTDTNDNHLIDITDRVLSFTIDDQFDPDSPFLSDISLAKFTNFTVTVDDSDEYFKDLTPVNRNANDVDRFVPSKFGMRIIYEDENNNDVPICMGILTQGVNRDEKNQTYSFNFRDFSLLFKNVNSNNFSYIGTLPQTPGNGGRAGQDYQEGSSTPGAVIPATSEPGVKGENGSNYSLNFLNLPTDQQINDIAYGTGHMAIAMNGGTVRFSNDIGETWTSATLDGPTPGNFISICFRADGFNMWVATDSNGKVWFSTGINPTAFKYYNHILTEIPTTSIVTIQGGFWYVLFGTPSGIQRIRFQIQGSNSPTIGTYDGIVYTTNGGIGSLSWSDPVILFGGNNSVVFGTGTGASALQVVKFSSDGDQPLSFATIGSGAFTDVHVRGVIVIATLADGKIRRSTDTGGTWVQVADVGTALNTISHVTGSQYVVMGANGQCYISSDDGATWSPQATTTLSGSSLLKSASRGDGLVIGISHGAITDSATAGQKPDVVVSEIIGQNDISATAFQNADLSRTYYYIRQEKPVLMGYIQARTMYESARMYRIDEYDAPVADVRAIAIKDPRNETNTTFIPESTHYTFEDTNLVKLENTNSGATGQVLLGRTDTLNLGFKCLFYVQRRYKSSDFCKHIFRIVFGNSITIVDDLVRIDDDYWSKGNHLDNFADQANWNNVVDNITVGTGLEEVNIDAQLFEGVVDNTVGNMWRALQARLAGSTKHYIYFNAEGNFVVGERLEGINDATDNSKATNDMSHDQQYMIEVTNDFTYKSFNRIQKKSKKYQVTNGNFLPLNTDGDGIPRGNGRFFRGGVDIGDKNYLSLGQLTPFSYKEGDAKTLNFGTYGLQFMDQQRIQAYFGNTAGAGGLSLLSDAASSGTHEAPFGYGIANSDYTNVTERPFSLLIENTKFSPIGVFTASYTSKALTLLMKAASTNTAINIPNRRISYSYVLPTGVTAVTDGKALVVEPYGYPMRKFPILVTTNVSTDTSLDGTTGDDLVIKNGISDITINTPYTLVRGKGSWTEHYILKFWGNKKIRFRTREMIQPFWEAGDINDYIEVLGLRSEFGATLGAGLLTRTRNGIEEVIRKKKVMVEKSTFVYSSTGDTVTSHILLERK